MQGDEIINQTMRLAIAANANIVTHALSRMEMCKAKQICHTFLMRSCDAVNVDEHWDLGYH